MAETLSRLNALNDLVFLKIMGEKGDEQQLISFLNAVLNRTGNGSISEVEIIENKELPPDILNGKLSKLDIRAKLKDDTRVNIEVQLKNQYNMRERSLFYWAKEYGKGISPGQDYRELPAVIVINILDFNYIKLDDFHTSFHLYEDTHKDYRLTGVLEIHYIEMVKFRKVNKKDMNNPLQRWLVYFDKHSGIEQVQEVLIMDTAIQAAQAKMEMIQRDPALLHAYEMFELSLYDHEMSLRGALEEGMRKGMQEGKLEGKQEGMREGKQEGMREVAKALKASGDAFEKIAGITGLSLDEIAHL
ncbi:MAG: Rpn family recombination-promoting nuclease/putative transposase [Treponema sp.]|jgi:predicted transposase/invertase (TIGR01784 family)|nr:Rpn family recombination-promoting nuclease/putative transposase [Treponema sp.]